MSAPRNKLQDYVFTLKKIPDFDKLSIEELFLLGYSVGKHEGRTPVGTLASQLIRSHTLFQQGLLTHVQKSMVEYLIFEGTYEGIDGILEAFSASHAAARPQSAVPLRVEPAEKAESHVEIERTEASAKPIAPPPVPAKKSHDSLPSTQELFNELAPPSKRTKPEGKEESEKVVVIPSVAPAVVEEEKKAIGEVQDDEKSLELIKKLQEEEKKELEEVRRKRDSENLDKAECKICMDRIEPTEYNPLEPCGHLFHMKCLRKYVETQMDARTFPILCPLPECKSDIDTTYIKELLEEDTFKLFDQYSFKSFVEGKTDEYSCCPTPDCSYVFVWLSKEDSNDFTCPKCKKRYCLNCKCLFHKGMTCKEYEVNNKHTVRVHETYMNRRTTTSS